MHAVKGFRVLGLGLAMLARLSFAQSALSQDSTPPPPDSFWSLDLAAGRSLVPFLGDSDLRNNFTVGLEYIKPEKHLRIGKRSGELFQELYYEHSGSKGGAGYYGNLPAQYDAAGYLFGARYIWGLHGAYKLYGDIGLGLYYDTQRTEDLPSRLNSTPFLDFGVIIPNGRNPVTVGFRFLHISNGGTVPPNGGQNQLFLDAGVQF
jgi:hypothetical protein